MKWLTRGRFKETQQAGRLLLFIIACALLSACTANPLARVYEGEPLFLVTANQPAVLDIQGRREVLYLDIALTPGQPVEKWKAANQVAREKGERLPERLTVAELLVTYAEGAPLSSNIRYGESVSAELRDWWNPVDGFIQDLPFARVRWTRPLEEDSLQHVVVYRMAWANPRPDIPIRSVTLKPSAGLGNGTLAVFAVSSPTKQKSPAENTTYFVATDGDDASAGSFEAPWASLAKAAATIRPGDTVYVRGGTYKLTRRVAFRGLKAPEGQRTRVIGYPGETAVFDCMDALWDTSPDRERLGFEVFPHDQSMIHVFDCERFTLSNLHIIHSRARGFGCESGRYNEISHNFVFRTYGPGIRFARQRDSICTGNTIIRACSASMAAVDARLPDSPLLDIGPAGRRYTTRTGTLARNPPMESLDSGNLVDCQIRYNEIGWGDKECMLIDGNADRLRIHHNYIHNAHNRPWVGGIAPNGYGRQRNIEIDHNIAHHVGTAFGIGTEGGGLGENVRIHHNIAFDCHWAVINVTGAWGDGNADLKNISVYNNTGFHNGYLDSNRGPAGGIAVSFARAQGKEGRAISGVVEDITIANNLILQPRDYVLSLNHDGDPVASRILFTHNLSDLAADSNLINGINNPRWRSQRDVRLMVTQEPVLRDPANRDFRPLVGSIALDGGIKIGPDGKPVPSQSSYIGAFGPGAKWVEVDKNRE